MSFDWPLALLALAVVPLAAAAYVVLDRRRAGREARFATPALMPNLVPRRPGRARHLPIAVLLIGIGLLVTGFARPHATISVKDEQATVILALDVSRSMSATDVRPTRLGAAQAAAGAFLETVPESLRVGAVSFATRANVVAPSHDRDVVRAALGQARPGEGTALGEAVLLSLRVAATVPREDGTDAPPASILLLSDGAQTQGEVTPTQAAQRARAAGVPVFTVVLGTPDGVVERKLTGGFTERIRVPPDPTALRQVAATSGGQFFEAADAERLKAVYEELGSRLGHRDKDTEITVAFAGAGMLLLLAAGALSAAILRRLP